MQNAAGHWQGRQGRAVGHSSAAAGRHGVAGAGRSHRDRYRRCRRHHLGHQFAARPAERRSRPDVGARCRLRCPRQRRHAGSVLRLRNHQRQHGGRLDHVGLRGSRDRRRHRDDVDGRPPRRGPVHDGQWQSSFARPPSAVASGGLRRRRRDARRHYAAGCRQAGVREPAAGRQRHQERPFRQEPRSRPSRGWQPCARPRGISAAADHARRTGRSQAGLHGGGGLSARRQGHDLSQPHPAKISRSRHQFRAPCRQFVGRRRWFGRASAGLAELCQGARPEAARPRGGDGEYGRFARP